MMKSKWMMMKINKIYYIYNISLFFKLLYKIYLIFKYIEFIFYHNIDLDIDIIKFKDLFISINFEVLFFYIKK